MNLVNLIVQSLRLETFTCMVGTLWKSKTENHAIDTIVASTDATPFQKYNSELSIRLIGIRDVFRKVG